MHFAHTIREETQFHNLHQNTRIYIRFQSQQTEFIFIFYTSGVLTFFELLYWAFGWSN